MAGTVGLMDFFRFGRRKGGRQKGRRRAATPGRVPGDRTVQLGAHREPLAPAPLPAAHSPAATVVAPRPAYVVGATAAPMLPQPAPLARGAGPLPPRAAQSGEAPTRYVRVPGASENDVVAVLVAVKGELRGQVYKLFDGENRLGRSRDCEVELASEEVSRLHAKIVHRDGIFAIAPLSDQNPTIVNDEPTQGAELGDGDYIKLGSTTLRFRTVV